MIDFSKYKENGVCPYCLASIGKVTNPNKIFCMYSHRTKLTNLLKRGKHGLFTKDELKIKKRFA